MSQVSTYSFLDVTAAIVGVGGAFNIGSGAGVAEEGITITREGDKNTMTIGADGKGQHSLNATKAGSIKIRLLKTSPTNNKLSLMYNLQTISSASHGLNVITIQNNVSGDSHTAVQCAFKKHPEVVYNAKGDMLEWEFDAITIDSSLGGGIVANLATFGIGGL